MAAGGALTQFTTNANGGSAQFITNAGGRVDFSGTTGTANNNQVTAGSIAGAGRYQLGANQLTVGSNNLSTTVSGSIEDGGNVLGTTGASLVKVGTGTLTLSGTNTYTGATTINAGTLIAASSGALPVVVVGTTVIETAVKVNTGATLQVADGVAADIGSLADGNAGGGSVVIGTSSLLTIGAGSPATTTFSGTITGPGSLELDGGSLTLTGAGNNIGGDLDLCACDIGGLTINGGSLVVGGSTSVEDGTLAVTNGGTLRTGDLLGSGIVISGAGSTVTATGTTSIGAFGPGTLTISGGGVLNSQGPTEIDSFAGTPSATVTGAGSAWNVSGLMTVGNGTFGGPGALTISNGGAVNATGSFMEIGDQATGTSQVTVTGAGSVLNVTRRMAVGDASGESGSGPGSLTIANGGVVNARGPFLDIGDAFTGTSLVTVTGTGSTLNVTTSLAVGTQCGCEVGTLTIADGAVVNSLVFTGVGTGSTLNLGTGGLAGSIVTPTIVDDGRIIANFTDALTLAANISGNGTLTKTGSGTLTLSGNNTYAGATTINGGTLSVTGGISNSSSVTVNAGGTLGGTGFVSNINVNAAARWHQVCRPRPGR